MQSDTHLWNVLGVPQPVPDGPEKTAILGQKLQELFGGIAGYIAECAVAGGQRARCDGLHAVAYSANPSDSSLGNGPFFIPDPPDTKFMFGAGMIIATTNHGSH